VADLTGAMWRKSSYSSANGGACVEVADLTGSNWRKSSHSSANGGNCVEVAAGGPGVVAVRDSKDPDGPALIFSPADWSAFIASLKG
jgi:Domain of unknown function (DUF397)